MIFDCLMLATDTASTEDINSHLIRCDASFVPHLSGRVDLFEYSRRIFEHATTYEAWHEKELVALVAAYLSPVKTCYITNVSVETGYSRRGIASHLLERCIKQTTALGGTELVLQVHRHNSAAYSLYRRCGFSVAESSGDQLLMKFIIRGLQIG